MILIGPDTVWRGKQPTKLSDISPFAFNRTSGFAYGEIMAKKKSPSLTFKSSR